MKNVNQTSSVEYANVATQHHYNDDVFPQIVVNNGHCKTVADTVAFVNANQTELEGKLAKAGALLFRGFPIDSAEAFDVFSAGFGYPNFTYQESLSNAVRINFTERVFTANEAPKDVEIFLHHEMAQTPISPSKLFFFCQSAAEQGGATPLCRSDKLFEALKAENPSLASDFKEKGLKYTTTMPAANDANSGQGRSWKSTLSVETLEEAEAKLQELGYSWQWLEDGSLRAVTPVLPAVIELDDGAEVFYNQLIAAYMGWKGVRENPSSAITFGDGSAIPKDGLERVSELAEDFTFDLEWQDGDVAIVDNYRAMHGRRPYSGERKRVVLVALVASER
ncbi:TauD/TfdA family dioxygenase [Alteromonas sp. McT4-15]|uniref:TauD/TfdA family dioxygenase n=1 Tax=Alteromonas sp. McT4-15 TaxID=2881256 RepID=UPI001CF89B86|nr:TauD/TfdA family dioxygenase [Alteromonas sp. McT4-15]MCB4434889.1 TauD/TfdA family dioxygenase [Alteromonas sp. McT4-15]